MEGDARAVGEPSHLPGARANASRSASATVALALATAFALAGCSHRAVAPPRAPQAVQPGRFHTVAAGENLFHLAQRYDVTPEAIARENGIDDPALVAQGRVLFIPGGRGNADSGSYDTVPSAPGGAGSRSGPHATVPAARPPDPARVGRLLWPVRGVIYSPFGPRGAEHHDGLDLAAPEGTPVVAAEAGTVVFAGEQRGYGRIVLVAHEGDLVTVYAHNRENQVKAGERVVRGQQLATVGHSGRASGPHLHFEVRDGTQPRDPLALLR